MRAVLFSAEFRRAFFDERGYAFTEVGRLERALLSVALELQDLTERCINASAQRTLGLSDQCCRRRCDLAGQRMRNRFELFGRYYAVDQPELLAAFSTDHL